MYVSYWGWINGDCIYDRFIDINIFSLHRALSIDMMCGNQRTALVAKKGRSACARCGTFLFCFDASSPWFRKVLDDVAN